MKNEKDNEKKMKIVKEMEGVKETVKTKGATFRQPTCESESDDRNELEVFHVKHFVRKFICVAMFHVKHLVEKN